MANPTFNQYQNQHTKLSTEIHHGPNHSSTEVIPFSGAELWILGIIAIALIAVGCMFALFNKPT